MDKSNESAHHTIKNERKGERERWGRRGGQRLTPKIPYVF
jgi:hypothetical protein